MSKNIKFYAELSSDIARTYEEGVTLPEAEKLAAKFLTGQLMVSSTLAVIDLDAKMRKAGTKSVRAAVYLEASTSADKKPTEATLAAIVEINEEVKNQQEELDKAEVSRDELQRMYDIFGNAHIYFRGIAKGNFGG